MDLPQPSLKNNSLNRAATNTGNVLLPPTNNIRITTATTNSTSTAVTIENMSTATSSPSTSPKTSVSNHHKHCRNSHTHVTQKTNQVSTVLLYNIPIVSLYIEDQERLCLAQISNTLLKRFSYNEIHNRRVALGITCVQCTPVQLEILRRAGAMPVSSRRCGMITRREAERLCKSFLGDNTPPRLPEDFAFNVQHKCSWGCRGSFLPSRYNSSRAKCIKCHYCGMFFSPNKFIFHSHRIGPGDKYVQPDAANFNSWRRHMMLTGQPPQEVIYAWEDVKAMFNGGTRKRLMISNRSSPIPRVTSSSPGSCSAGASSSSMNRDHSTDDVNEDPLLSNIQKTSNSVNTVTAAAAVLGVTAVAVGSTVRPLNLHFQASTAAGLTTESSYSVEADMHLIPAAALSRSFMMDYMWQHAHQVAKNSYNQQYQQQHQSQQKVKYNNSAFSLPWLNTTIGTPADIQNLENHHTNVTHSASVNSSWPNSAATDITRNLTQIINTSAFKPVIQQQKQNKLAETSLSLSSTKSRRRHSKLQLSTYAHDHCNIQMPTSASQPAQNKIYNSLFSSNEDGNDEVNDAADVHRQTPNKRLATNNRDTLEDDILVDIETTEDEKPVSFATNTIVSTSSFTIDNAESRDDIENNAIDNDKQTTSDEDVIDVVHNDNDDTVLEFASLNPLAIMKHSTKNDRKALSIPSTFTSPTTIVRVSNKSDKLYNIDNNNSENVPPRALSVSPKSDSNSSGSRSSECFYIKGKHHYETAGSPNSVPRNISLSPVTYEDKNINLDNMNPEKSTKNARKRPCEKIIQDFDKVSWRQINDSSANDNTDEDGQSDAAHTVDSSTKYKKNLIEPHTKEAQFIEALTHKYELTYYNNTNNSSCKNVYRNNNSPISNNNLNNNNNNEFWKMARLCMQRPINYEQNQKVQQNNQQQLASLPTFYYRQQQLHLSPAEHYHENSQMSVFPSTQQVYLHLQQHQQSVQKTQNHYFNEITPSPTPNSSSDIPVMYVPESVDGSSATYNNMHENNVDSTIKATRPNGIG